MKEWMKALLILAALVAWIGCYSSPTAGNDDGGSGSEIVGVVEEDTTGGAPKVASAATRAGRPVAGASIYVFRSTRQADTSAGSTDNVPAATTDSEGAFLLTGIGIGTWIVEANDNSGRSATAEVYVPLDGIRVDAGTITLAESASLQFTVNTSLTGVHFHVYVLGTRLYAENNGSDLSISLSGIPTGEPLDIRLVVTSPVPYSATIQDVVFDPGQVEQIAHTLP